MEKLYIHRDPTMSPRVFVSGPDPRPDGEKHITINTHEPCPPGEHVWEWRIVHTSAGSRMEFCEKCNCMRSAADPDRAVEQDMLPVTLELLRTKYGFTDFEFVEVE